MTGAVYAQDYPEIICACGCQRPLPPARSRTSYRQRKSRDVRYIRGHTTRGRIYAALPTEHPTTLDIAWAAGVYEGEGYACSRHGCTAITLGQNEEWILLKLQRRFGGQVGHYQKRSRKGNEQPDFFQWSISGTLARGFLMTIYCFLSPRRKSQARVALTG